MKEIRLKFVGFDFPGFDPENELLYKIASRRFNIKLVDRNPDYIIDGGFGIEHYDYDCVKISINGENFVPNFNEFDYAIGHDYLTFGDRYLRVPHFVFYPEFRTINEHCGLTDEQLVNRDFCSFVVSNGGGDPLRTEFFKKLSEYKHVASGGLYLNNVGGRVADKLEFIKNYKFNIAFENSASLGYTTEKVMQPLAIGTLPIYYGNPRVTDDFHDTAMVIVSGAEDVKRAIDEIVYLDTHQDAYLERIHSTKAKRGYDYYDFAIEQFLINIFGQDLAKARRTNRHGCQARMRAEQRRVMKQDELIHLPYKKLRKMYGRMLSLVRR